MPETTVHAGWIAADGTEETRGGAPEALFPYWSFTKTVIAVCALQLSETGVVDLDARLEQQTFTLRHLLGHTAGLADYGALPAYHRDVAADATPWPRDRLLDEVLARGPLFAPGAGWSYSNVGTMLARERIEAASGRSLAQLVTDLIGRPLGLASIELATSRDQFARLHWSAARHYHPGWVYHGCLTGTALDAARLLHAVMSGRLLSETMLEQMLSRRHLGGAIAGRPWTDCGYGLGLMTGRMGDDGRAIGHSGGGPFSVNAVYHFPDRRRPVTVACFTDGTDEGVAEFAAARLSRDAARPSC